MPEQGVVVEVELGIEAEQVSLPGLHQGVDLQERAVGLDEGLVEVLQQRHRLLDLGRGEAEFEGDLARLEGAQPDQRIDRLEEDFFRGVGGDFLDVHPPFGAGHQGHLGGGAIDQEGDVELVKDVAAFFDQHALDDLAFRAGLVGDEGHAEHVAGVLFHLVGALGDLHPAALAAAAGVDLRLHREGPVAEPPRPVARRVAVVDHVPLGNRYPEVAQDRLCLVLVNVQSYSPGMNIFVFNALACGNRESV